ncbi:hypothetical protein HZB60_12945 [candidate division KSB1 bacterium]|nr:hypothetical protein [candidate division KSB1 bacterium]
MTKRIGLLLGNEYSWPLAYETVLKRLKLSLPVAKQRIQFETERLSIEPFNLRQPVKHDLIIDRLGYWHMTVREWQKKACLMHDTYLVNNPFTFQAMEKHSAYCVMIRLGYKIPETWLVPQKQLPPGDERARVTAENYHRMFKLDDVAQAVGGYPVFLKPYNGGGWRGVVRCNNSEELHRAYDASGEETMHVQAGVKDFDVFVRCLGCGPQVIAMKYDPSQPLHKRYVIDHKFLTQSEGRYVTDLTRLINACFGWEYNSCEALIKKGVAYPIDYANATPDTSLISLHYYFPWAIKALIRWTVFCAATNRKMRLDMNMREYFKIADRDIAFSEKVKQYNQLERDYFETDKFEEFCAKHLAHVDEAALEYFTGPEWDAVLVERIRRSFPAHEHDEFTAHYRGILEYWAQTEGNRLGLKSAT